MKCSTCGKEMGAGATSCPSCHNGQERATSATVVLEAQSPVQEPPPWYSTTVESKPPRRHRSVWRFVAVGVGGLAVAGLLTAGVISDIGTRHSLDASQRDLADRSASLKTANAQLATASDELVSLRAAATQAQSTINTQQQKIDQASQREQQLTACTGSLAVFMQDIAAQQEAAANRDYSRAFTACAAAGQDLPLP